MGAAAVLLTGVLLWTQVPDPRVLFERAMQAQKQGRTADAAKLLGEAAAVAPGNFAIQANLGALRAQLGDLDGALAAYRRAIEINPGVARLHLNVGIAHVRRGGFAEALGSLDAFLKAEPRDVQGRELRALCLFQLARFKESGEAYRAIVEEGDEPLAALYGWGQSLLKTGDRAGAERVFERLFRRHGSSSEAALLEAQMMMAENRLEEALAKLTELASRKQRLRGVDLWRGIALEGLGRAPEAREAYRAEFEASRDLAAAYALGVLAGKSGAEKEALDWLDKARSIDGPLYNIAYHRGRALLRLGDAAGALPLLEESARRDPSSVPDRYLLLQIYQKLGRGADAQRVSGEIRRLREDELDRDRKKVTGTKNERE